MNAEEFFQLPPSLLPFAEAFLPDAFPWDWIRRIQPALEQERFVPKRGAVPEGFQMRGFAYIHPSVSFPLFGALEGPCWLAEGVVLEPGVVLKGNVILGAGCTVGSGAVLENCLLLEHVRISARALVVDSVVGNHAFLGVGASVLSHRLEVGGVLKRESAVGAVGPVPFETLGSVLGDGVVVGHHALIRPGSVLPPDTRVAEASVFHAPLPR